MNKINRTTLDKLLKRVEKPARYIGGELNSVIKEGSEQKVKFAFAFPDIYEIGMSYVGLEILYNILNKEEDIVCERVFAPAPDMEVLMRDENIPLFSLETKSLIKDFDILGFTLQYEMSFTNILNMLDLSGIPLRSSKRAAEEQNEGKQYPLVIAGGPCAFNPEPLAPFVDLFVIGDGEEADVELCKLYRECSSKDEFLSRACTMQGIYVPKFYEPEYNDDGTISCIKKTYESAPDMIKKCLIEEIEDVPFPTKPIVPFINTVHDRAVVEIFRGCSRGCRFCQAGMIYRPVRERKNSKVLKLSEEQLDNTGHEELSLMSLSTSDYSDFENLATELTLRCKARNVSLSLPSLRLDSFSFKVLSNIQEYKKSGLTFAPEAGTQRLRDVINKQVTEDELLTAVNTASDLGWQRIKLYFMMGLPTETYEDIEGIGDLARKLMEGKCGRFNVTVSVSNFVPKAFTPFQWSAQDSREAFNKKHDFLANKLKIRGVKFSYHDSYVSILEAMFARGDRRVADVLELAWESGCKFDGWSERFKEDIWKQAIKKAGLSDEFYAGRKRDFDETLPWDIIDAGISKEYLISEAKKAKKGELTLDCRLGCNNCGINDTGDCVMISKENVNG